MGAADVESEDLKVEVSLTGGLFAGVEFSALEEQQYMSYGFLLSLLDPIQVGSICSTPFPPP
jgi:hypothetical protein